MTQEEYELLMGRDYSSMPFGSVEIEQPQPTWDEYWKEQIDRHLAAIDPSSDMGDMDRLSTIWGNFAPGTILPGKLKPSDYTLMVQSGRRKAGLTAAIKDPVNGYIYTGGYHPVILDTLQVAADMGQIEQSWVNKIRDFYHYGSAGYGKTEMDKLFGFVNDAGEFFTRHDADLLFGADEASALYRRIRKEAPLGFGERPIDNPVNPNPVVKKGKGKGKYVFAAGPLAAETSSPTGEDGIDYSLLVEGAYDQPVDTGYLLDTLKRAKEAFMPSGPSIPPSPTPEVQGITGTPPEPGRNRLTEIPGAISEGIAELPGKYEEALLRHQEAISPSSEMSDLDRWGTMWGNFAPGSVRVPPSKAATVAEQMVQAQMKGKPINPSYSGVSGGIVEFTPPTSGAMSMELRDRFGASLTKVKDPESRKYINWVNANRNQVAIHPNSKTGLSLDFTTSCCARAGGKGACAYCYVEQPRTGLNELGMRKYITQTKRVVDTPYNGEIRRMPKGLVTELNRDGGLRGQSFSDYIPEKHEAMWQAALDDAASLKSPENPDGLFIKIITKKPEMVERFGSHPNARFNVSIDYLPKEMSNAPSIEEALALKTKFPGKVKVRSVALNQEQAMRQLADPRIDVITLYHGPTGEELYKIVATQNPQLVKRLGEDAIRAELATWQSMKPKSQIHKDLESSARILYGTSKVCCEGGRCAVDRVNCGFRPVALGALIMGVEIPDKGGE